MSFTDTQVKALSAKLNGKHVRTREEAGRTLSYIEGWHAVAEANRIFGFDGWSRETVSTTCVWQGALNGRKACSYIARVRIEVCAGDRTIVREGSGSGHGTSLTLGEAHESALKEAETDATKRALVTFGNPFGLALYDKEQRGVRHSRSRATEPSDPQRVQWVVLSQDGQPLGTHEDPIKYCSDIRRRLEAIDTPGEAMAFWKRNQETVAQLRRAVPDLKTEKGQHYAEIVGALFTSRLEDFAKKRAIDQPKRKVAKASARIDKAGLFVATPRRVRDKDHLRYVASQPCLICGREPSQAHHIRFAQPRSMGRKVSDQWTVPLCTTHHRALHAAGNEERWWKERNVNPILEAERLWRPKVA